MDPYCSELTPAPQGWTQCGHTAQFFGGQGTGSSYALMWQWCISSQSACNSGDWDQVDVTRSQAAVVAALRTREAARTR